MILPLNLLNNISQVTKKKKYYSESFIKFRIIPGSPFRVQVRDRLDANRVNVKMSPVMRANVLQEILIDGQAAGPGTPSVDITDIHGKFFTLSRETKFLLLPLHQKQSIEYVTMRICIYTYILYRAREKSEQ
jgi:hypothetical protein